MLLALNFSRRDLPSVGSDDDRDDEMPHDLQTKTAIRSATMTVTLTLLYGMRNPVPNLT